MSPSGKFQNGKHKFPYKGELFLKRTFILGEGGDKKQKTYSISLTVLRIVNVTLNPFPVVLPHQGKERFIPNWSTLETMLFQVSEE